MLRTLQALACAAVLAAPAVAVADDTTELWVKDYDKAVEIAKAQGKDLLLNFTGSDWCGWCHKLDAEVFDHAEWQAAAKKDYVLVYVDFPRDEAIKAAVPNPERNQELQAKYAVRGFPSILFTTADGELFGQSGYQPGGVEKYLEHMGELRSENRPGLMKSLDLIKRLEGAEGEAKNPLYLEAVDLLAGSKLGAAYAPKLAEPVKSAIALDADNAQGIKLRAVKALLRSGQGDDALMGDARTLDPKNEHGALEYVAWANFMKVRDLASAKAALASLTDVLALGDLKDKEIGFGMCARAAIWSNGPLTDPAGAKSWATKAKAIGSDDEATLETLEKILDADSGEGGEHDSDGDGDEGEDHGGDDSD